MHIKELDDAPELELISDDDDDEDEEVEGEELGESEQREGPFVIALIHLQLYLGTTSAVHPAVLSQFSITHVLGVGEDLPIALSESSRIPRVKTKTAAAKGDQYTYKEKGVSYMVLAVPDSEETALLNFMHGCFEFIDAALNDPDHGRHNRVMVMCASGMSASATVLGSYLICRRKLPLAVCMGKMREAHPAVEPNKGFARHLRFLERNGELPEWSMP